MFNSHLYYKINQYIGSNLYLVEPNIFSISNMLVCLKNWTFDPFCFLTPLIDSESRERGVVKSWGRRSWERSCWGACCLGMIKLGLLVRGRLMG